MMNGGIGATELKWLCSRRHLTAIGPRLAIKPLHITTREISVSCSAPIRIQGDLETLDKTAWVAWLG